MLMGEDFSFLIFCRVYDDISSPVILCNIAHTRADMASVKALPKWVILPGRTVKVSNVDQIFSGG